MLRTRITGATFPHPHALTAAQPYTYLHKCQAEIITSRTRVIHEENKNSNILDEK
jgi:hypothetical protein